MLTMQYSFTLPADYDMEIIRKRIREKGSLLDGFEGLVFKAYLFADRSQCYSKDNFYAPFYLWRDSRGTRRFIESKGFEALSASFGRPSVRTWLPVVVEGKADPLAARWATRELFPMTSDLELAQVEEHERVQTQEALKRGADVAISAYEPTNWTLVRFRLWPALELVPKGTAAQVYQVGYLATGVF
jgi:hypothetical protein